VNVLIVSHTYIAPINRDKWRILASMYPGITITLVIPTHWPSCLFTHEASICTDEERSNYRIHALPVYKAGNEVLYTYHTRPLYNVIRACKPDLVHVEQGDSAASYAQINAFAKAAGCGYKSVFFTWVNWQAQQSIKERLVLTPLTKINLLCADGAITGNHDAKMLLQKKGFKKPIMVLPQLGVNQDIFRPALAGSARIIGYVGRFTPEKGIFLLLEAFAQLAPEHPEYSLHYIGKGPSEDLLHKRITDLGLSARVHISPAMPHHEVATQLQHMTFLVLPSYDTPTWREQFGHILIEAMACRVPVIGSNAGEIPHVVHDTGLIFSQQNLQALLAQMQTLMQDEDLRKTLGERGFGRVQKLYTHQAIAKTTHDFWQQLFTHTKNLWSPSHQKSFIKRRTPVSKIVVIGAGYVGLVTGACLAQKGNHVVIVESNQEKINTLLQGNIPFYEPWLDTIVSDALKKKTLTFETSIAQGLAHKPRLIFSCVGTPSLPDGAADLSYVEKAAAEIGKHITQYSLVINKSTVPVGTARRVQSIIQHELEQRKTSVEFDVASNPEFLKEGDAVSDFLNPDRVVVGIESEKAADLLRELYSPFLTNEQQFVCMNIESAELTKYASNAMLATRISFMNQLAGLADNVGADIEDVKKGMAKDKRIGSAFLNAGIGYGGSCFPKDVSALAHMGTQHHFPMTLIQEVNNINHVQRLSFINQITTHYGPALEGKKVGVWGLSFKPETDDIRCSPAIDLINNMLEKKAQIIVFDPVAQQNIAALYGDKITYAGTAQDVLKAADFLVIVTEWKQFVTTPLEQFMQLKDSVIFDGRNCFQPLVMQALGLTYYCIGRNSVGKGERGEGMVYAQQDVVPAKAGIQAI